ncbi:MAG: hypothetical protein KatS3mg008_2242 [Acidimicrobiales bacterium]|nr:MAG: hypothetical protein KatS3mg008_2242 [Acidimicrobiales bacterium]
MDVLVPVAVVLLVALIVGFVALNRFVAKARAQTNEEVRTRLGGDPVLFDDEAEALGVESREQGYLRGMGCLGMNERELLFVQWKPRQEIRIALADIVEVIETTEHRGRDFGRPILAVRFRSAESQSEDGTDVIAWRVYDVGRWRDALRAG